MANLGSNTLAVDSFLLRKRHFLKAGNSFFRLQKRIAFIHKPKKNGSTFIKDLIHGKRLRSLILF